MTLSFSSFVIGWIGCLVSVFIHSAGRKKLAVALALVFTAMILIGAIGIVKQFLSTTQAVSSTKEELVIPNYSTWKVVDEKIVDIRGDGLNTGDLVIKLLDDSKVTKDNLCKWDAVLYVQEGFGSKLFRWWTAPGGSRVFVYDCSPSEIRKMKPGEIWAEKVRWFEVEKRGGLLVYKR